MLINTEETCKACDASRMDPAAKVLRCHHGPPTVFTVVTNLGSLQHICQFPPVSADQWCKQFSRKVIS